MINLSPKISRAMNKYVNSLITMIFLLSVLPVSSSYGESYKTRQRIITLAPNLTEICYSLGVQDKIIAITDNSNYPPQTRNKPSIGLEKNINISWMKKLAPTIIIADHKRNNPNQISKMIENGLNVKITTNDSIDEIYNTIKQIGLWTGSKKQSEILIDNMKTRISKIRSMVKNKPSQKVLFIVNSDPIMTCGKDSIPNILVNLIGSDNIATIGKKNNPFPNMEALVKRGPEIIFEIIIQNGKKIQPSNEIYRRWSKWPDAPAVKDWRIFVIPHEPVMIAGPRLIRGLEIITSAMYPELSEEILGKKPQDKESF